MLKRALVSLFLVLGLVSMVYAANDMISIQGKLEGVTSPVGLRFTLHKQSDGLDSPVWSSGNTLVLLDATGVFNSKLQIPGDIFFNNPDGLYMKITVNKTTVLDPPQRLTAAPYAFVAFVAKDLRGGVVSAESASSDIPAVYGENANWHGILGASSRISYAGVFGKNDAEKGYGVGGSALGTGGIGVYGYGLKYGVQGSSVPGIGVYGNSVSDIGVRGTGPTAGGSFESTSSWTGYGVVGIGGTAGVFGSSLAGDGVSGTTTEYLHSGVRGKASYKGISGISTVESKVGPIFGGGPIGGAIGSGIGAPGVAGKSSHNYGVYGISDNDIGIGGKGATAGGSFESTSGIGVYGRGVRGVYGETTATAIGNTAGVHGFSAAAFPPAVRAENTNVNNNKQGLALDIKGRVSMDMGYTLAVISINDDRAWTAAVHKSAGIIVIPQGYIGRDRVTVTNANVSAGSVILLTARKEVGPGTTSPLDNPINVGLIFPPANGEFTFKMGGRNETVVSYVYFLIIN